MILNLRKFKNKITLIPFLSVLALSSCSSGEMNNMDNFEIKCTKYLSFGNKLPKHIKNPITFSIIDKYKFEYSKSSPLTDIAKDKTEKKDWNYDVSSSSSYSFDKDLEITLNSKESIEFSPEEGKILKSLMRFRKLKYYILKASIKKKNYKGRWTLTEDSGGMNYISLAGTLKCNLINKN